MAVPDAHAIHKDVQSGKIPASASKKERTIRQLQTHINYLQRFYSLKPGMNGQWSLPAQLAFNDWLFQETKGFKTKDDNKVLAIQDDVREVAPEIKADRPVLPSQELREEEDESEGEESSTSSSSSSSTSLPAAKRQKAERALHNVEFLSEVFPEFTDCDDCKNAPRDAIASWRSILWMHSSWIVWMHSSWCPENAPCPYIYMYVCMYVCMYIYIYVCVCAMYNILCIQ